MNQRRTIVNTALSNRPAGTVVMVAALLGGLYYLYCLLRVPGAADPYAGRDFERAGVSSSQLFGIWRENCDQDFSNRRNPVCVFTHA